jgi:uncharacterized membrane protein
LAFLLLPDGSLARAILGFAALAFVPGYLVLEASLPPARTGDHRAMRAIAAVGISPVVVGLLALATVGVQGGFKPAAIVVVLTVGCLAVGALAFGRRLGRAADATPEAAAA